MDIIIAIRNLDFKAVTELLKAKFRRKGNTASNEVVPLHVAAEIGCVEMLTLLLKLGENINERDNEGTTALQVACQHGHYNAVSFLLKQGASVNREERNMLKKSLNFVGGQCTKIKNLLSKTEQEKHVGTSECFDNENNATEEKTKEELKNNTVPQDQPVKPKVKFERREKPIRQRSFDANSFHEEQLDGELSARRKEALLIDAEKKKELLGKRKRSTQRKHSVGRKL